MMNSTGAIQDGKNLGARMMLNLWTNLSLDLSSPWTHCPINRCGSRLFNPLLIGSCYLLLQALYGTKAILMGSAEPSGKASWSHWRWAKLAKQGRGWDVDAAVLEQQSGGGSKLNSFRQGAFCYESVSQTDQLTTCFRMSRGWWGGEMGVDDQKCRSLGTALNYWVRL